MMRATYITLLTMFACALAGCFTYVDRPDLPEEERGEEARANWIVSAERASEILETTGAVVLDTRSPDAFSANNTLAGSSNVTWQEFSRQDAPYRGLLLDDVTLLEQRLGALGVARSRHVLVIGDPAGGWGEDGRIVWMLRALGHQGASIVDGGYDALAKLDENDRWEIIDAPVAFEATPGEELTANITQVEEALEGGDAVLLDTREAREYNGEVPYGETRGGHLPDAVHVHFSEFIDAETGSMLPATAIEARLEALGVTPDREVIAYCTGGVRSAWVIVMLRHLGYEKARNYAGSMWEWSSMPAETHPLE
jgi:thiosulfate/3-mercaptopyruvate sulfurtransferase